MKESNENRFEQANQASQPGLVAELIQFLKHNKKFWLIPLLLVLLGLGVIFILGTTGAAPFIYTLF